MDAVDPLVEIALTDDEGFVRGWALNALGWIGDPRVAERLRPLLDVDMRPEVGLSAAAALASLGDAAGRERFETHVRGERWTLPSLRKRIARLPPHLVAWLALVIGWLAGTAVLLRWWEGWPQLVLAVGFVLAIEQAWLGARHAAARRAGVFLTSGLRGRATAGAAIGAIAMAAAWTTVLAALLSLDLGYLGVYVSWFFLVHRILRDRDERSRTRRIRA